MGKPVVIGIAGGSGSGKSTVLEQIVRSLGQRRMAILDHDAYYHDLGHLPHEARLAENFDHPNALETTLLCTHIDMLLRGLPIEKPRYDFETHLRSPETDTVVPRSLIVVEGILVLAEPSLRERMDIRIFVDADHDVRLMRRIKRDMSERGRSITSILDQYENTVRPMHLEFVEPSKRQADVIIPRGGKNTVAIEMVLARIRAVLDHGKSEIAVRPRN